MSRRRGFGVGTFPVLINRENGTHRQSYTEPSWYYLP
jgi:hypothetical protein